MTAPDGNEPFYRDWPILDWAEFLTTAPAKTCARVSEIVVESTFRDRWTPNTPVLRLHCDTKHCAGDRYFEAQPAHSCRSDDFENVFLTYSCRNCGGSMKIFALSILPLQGKEGAAIKIGEFPPLGTRFPTRLNRLVGPDRDLLIKGIRAEEEGLGIGAFAYYRRVVENQRDRLLGQILLVSRAQNAPIETTSAIEAALKERHFDKSVRMVKDVVPDSLRIDGHSPMTLLHRALSVGLHQESDHECLERAKAIRLVLCELAERVGQTLRDVTELSRQSRN